MKKHFILFSILVFVLSLSVNAFADVIPTSESVDYKGSVSINGIPAPVGTVVDAFDPQGIHCGTYIVGISGAANDSAGIYGFMHVYRDDIATTGIDEGADPGDSIFIKVNGINAVTAVISGNLTWTADGDLNEVDLSVTGINVAFSQVVKPPTQGAQPGDTVRFVVGIQNDGNALDFYGISALSDTSASPGWNTVNQDTISYALPGDTTYVYFDAILTVFGGGGDTTYIVHYTLSSLVDTTVTYQDSVVLLKSITDADDGYWAELPDRFILYQNYPNPFNPSTIIAFSLPAKSSVELEIINMLGQRIDTKYLGNLSVGMHEIEYDASHLASGVYFYRIVTDRNALNKKMILLK